MYISRAEQFARFIIEHNSTIRSAAKHFAYSKSTVHNDVSNKLKKYNIELYYEVQKVLRQNFCEKHIRGGRATKQKYENK